jgi:uncharacterized protein
VKRFRYAHALAAIACFACFSTAQAETTITPDVLRTAERASAAVSDGQQDVYRNVMSAYAREETAHPDDVQLVLARCRFTAGFAESEEILWSDVAQTDFQACQKDLQARFPNDAEASLFMAGQHYGKEAFTIAHALLPASAHWTVQQRAKLHAILSRAHTAMKQTDLAGQEALASVQLDPGSDQLVTALRYLCTTGHCNDAEAMLSRTSVPQPVWKEWQRVEFAADSLSPAAALAELQRAKAAGIVTDAWLEARIYLRAGKRDQAAHALACACTNTNLSYQTAEQYQTRLNVAVALGNGKLASTTLQAWMTKSGITMPLLFAYGNVLRHEPLQLFSPSLAQLTLALLAMMLVLLCVPGVIAFPAHYRGIVRGRLHKTCEPIFMRMGLRHMWMASAALLIASSAIPIFWGGGVLHDWVTNKLLSPDEQITIVSLYVAMLFAGSVLALPAAMRLTRREWLGDRGLKPALIIVAAWACVKGFMTWALWLTGRLAQVTHGTLHDRAIATLISASEHLGGPVLAMLIIAVLVPIYEELIFRGCILGGLTRHISFGWANVWQAAAFALMHNDMPHFLFYFLMGLLGGWLARKTRGLAAPIALHMVNNAIAGVAVLMAA